MCQTQLVNIVVIGFLDYSYNVYKWSAYIFKQVEQWSKNFIWTGDIMKKGMSTVNWAISSPFEN